MEGTDLAPCGTVDGMKRPTRIEYRILPDGGGVERIRTTVHVECSNGHPYIPENIRIRKHGKESEQLVCLTCERNRSRKHKNVKRPRKIIFGE